MPFTLAVKVLVSHRGMGPLVKPKLEVCALPGRADATINRTNGRMRIARDPDMMVKWMDGRM